MSTFFKSQKGFIFIDAVVGMVILTIALLSIVVAFRQSVVGITSANNRTKAAYLAQQQLSDLRQYEPSLKRDNEKWSKEFDYRDPTPGSKLVFHFKSTIVPADQIPVSLEDDVIPVQATVEWTESTGTQTFMIVTYYYN